MKIDIPNSPRLLELKKNKKKVVQRMLILYFCLFVSILIGLVYLSNISRLNISNIQVVGNKIIDSEKIVQIAQNEINGKYLWLIPKTNIFFYSKNSIKNNLEENLKRLKNINISVKEKNTLEVSVSEREALYTWCGDSTQNLTEKCYFLDKDGYAFDEAPYFSGEVYFKFYGPILKKDEIPTGSFFQKEDFLRLLNFKENISKINLTPYALAILDNGYVKIYLSKNKNTDTEDPFVFFKIDSNFDKLIENLQTAITTEPLQSSLKNNYASLLYLDLRSNNKVYYKFK